MLFIIILHVFILSLYIYYIHYSYLLKYLVGYYLHRIVCLYNLIPCIWFIPFRIKSISFDCNVYFLFYRTSHLYLYRVAGTLDPLRVIYASGCKIYPFRSTIRNQGCTLKPSLLYHYTSTFVTFPYDILSPHTTMYISSPSS